MDVAKGEGNQVEPEGWRSVVRKYQEPSLLRALWQLVNSVGAYVLVWALLYLSSSVSLWLVPPLVLLAGGLLVRVFIIFHDCTHGSFFGSRRANDIVGFVTGVLTFTPYSLWRKEHALHHSSVSDLDRRGFGDVPTMTVHEYRAASRWQRLGYRLVRNPWVLFGIAPIFMFLIHHRLPPAAGMSAGERRSVHWTNLGVCVMAVAMSQVFGFFPYLILQILVLAIAASWGTWLFYVQHQFEGVYWERKDNWDFVEAALKGSSFYKLPRVLQWFSGNIGFHHVHHLSSRIPNYNLQRCHNAESLFHSVQPIDFLASLGSLKFRLWDEASQRLVSFRDARELT